MENYISIGKIINFFGIKGEAKIGFSNARQIEQAKFIYLMDDKSKRKLEISSYRFQKNFAIVKFKEINDINDLIQYKGQRIFVSKAEVLKKLEENEFLINDLINCKVTDEKGELIGTVSEVSSNSGQDLLSIKNPLGQTSLVPFVDEFFPEVDIKNKKITIKLIEGLLN